MLLKYTTALLTISTLNFDRSVQFYRQLLCQEPNLLRSNIYAEFHISGVRLGIFRPSLIPHSAPSIPHPPSHTGMALCLEVESLEAAIGLLTNLGYPPPGNIMTASHGREIYAYDPDGNWLILHQG